MRSIASTARTLSGCAVGELLAYLSWNSAAPLAIHGIAMVALAAVTASSAERRVLLSFISIPPIERFCAGAGLARPLVRIMAGAAHAASGVALSNGAGP